MRLRSEAQIREDLNGIREIIAILEARFNRSPMDDLILEQHRERYQRISTELDLVAMEGLQVVLDGRGVEQHAVSADRLLGFLEPFQRAIRGVGRREVRADGSSFGNDEKQLTSASLRRMFDGSAGLVIASPAPPIRGEQLDLLKPTLFERAVNGVLEVLDAADETNMEDLVLDAANGLDANAISALTELVSDLAEAGAPTRIAWRGGLTRKEFLLTVLPGQAAILRDVLRAVTPHVEQLVVHGHLASVNDSDLTFHLDGDDGATYRGRIAEGLLSEAQAAAWSDVAATVDVETAIGRFERRSRPRYVLRSVRPA